MAFRPIYIFLLTIAGCIAYMTYSVHHKPYYSEPPSVIWRGDSLFVFQYCDNGKRLQLFADTLSLQASPDSVPYTFNSLCGTNSPTSSYTFQRKITTNDSSSYQNVAKTLVIGDLRNAEGEDALRILLRQQGVIDDQNNWQWGANHVVLMGNVLNSGNNFQIDHLWFIYGLQQKARQAGGRLHYLLGRSELATLNTMNNPNGNIMTITPKLRQTLRLDTTYFSNIFTADGLWFKWLSQQPQVLQINDYLFAYGGLDMIWVYRKTPLLAINKITQSGLAMQNNRQSSEWRILASLNNVLPGSYSGYFAKTNSQSGIGAEQMDSILQFYNAKAIFTALAPVRETTTTLNGDLYAVAPLTNGKTSEIHAVLLQQGKPPVSIVDGNPVPLSKVEKPDELIQNSSKTSVVNIKL